MFDICACNVSFCELCCTRENVLHEERNCLAQTDVSVVNRTDTFSDNGVETHIAIVISSGVHALFNRISPDVTTT